MSTEQNSKKKSPVVLLYKCTAINTIEIEVAFVMVKDYSFADSCNFQLVEKVYKKILYQ